jgi:hypothetical protein
MTVHRKRTSSAPVHRLSIAKAIGYLAEKHGVITTKSGLANLRARGGGPLYSTILRKVYYDPADIDDWVARQAAASRHDRQRATEAHL